MAKVNLAITVDSFVANWLNEQPEKRSTLVNKIIKQHMNNINVKKPQRKNVLAQRKLSFERHWEQLQRELELIE